MNFHWHRAHSTRRWIHEKEIETKREESRARIAPVLQHTQVNHILSHRWKVKHCFVCTYLDPSPEFCCRCSLSSLSLMLRSLPNTSPILLLSILCVGFVYNNQIKDYLNERMTPNTKHITNSSSRISFHLYKVCGTLVYATASNKNVGHVLLTGFRSVRLIS